MKCRSRRLHGSQGMPPPPQPASAFAQARLNEALGLAVGLGSVWLGADMLEPKALASPAESERRVTGAVVACGAQVHELRI
jgi:hypothetical protein